MMRSVRSAWTALRARRWLSLAFDVAVIVALFLAVHTWQTRDLPVDRPAPPTVLPLLGSGQAQSAIAPGRAGIVYFMAPWCRVCKASIGNLDSLVAAGAVPWATVVALDFVEPGEVQAFIEQTDIDLPVLLGRSQTAADWSVRAFPTYYVIDSNGRIDSRSVGYSTWLGMRWRSWLAGP
jgi:thiol-disulfide isomerase/thioredoxin